jgi:hypothetical protein
MVSYTGCSREDGSVYADCETCPREKGGWRCVKFLERYNRTRVLK